MLSLKYRNKIKSAIALTSNYLSVSQDNICTWLPLYKHQGAHLRGILHVVGSEAVGRVREGVTPDVLEAQAGALAPLGRAGSPRHHQQHRHLEHQTRAFSLFTRTLEEDNIKFRSYMPRRTCFVVRAIPARHVCFSRAGSHA